MELRHRLLSVLVTASLLAACAAEAPEAVPEAVDDPATATDAPGDAATEDVGVAPGDMTSDASDVAGDAPGADAAGGAGRDPQVPALHPVIDDWDETIVTITTADRGEVTVDAKVAVDPEERQRGLMEVEELPDGVGMLFVFEEERDGGFWMRNTLVPLDIAYIGVDGSIGTILAMEPCAEEAAEDCPTYGPDEPYLTALEVPQGWFEDAGVAEGDPVDWIPPNG